MSLSGFGWYAEYLTSAHWHSVADDFRRRFPNCQACGSKSVQVHHRSYANLGRERDDDLRALCEWCHKETHRIAAVTGNLEAATDLIISSRNRETVEGFFARGGTVTVVKQINSGSTDAPEPTPKQHDNEACICCNRRSGHRVWCLFHPDYKPLDSDQSPTRIAGKSKNRKKAAPPRRSCEFCGETVRRGSLHSCRVAKFPFRICCICDRVFVSQRRSFGRFTCPECR